MKKDYAKQEYLNKNEIRWYYGLYLISAIVAYLATLIVITL